jgi:bacillithiol biosynthesis deacetylase BshB1
MSNSKKIDVLAIATHPDDAELHCGGTLALSKSQGLRTGILDLTRGEMGTRGTVESRAQEAERAKVALNLDWRGNTSLPDGGLINNHEQQNRIIDFVRELKPEICLIPCAHDRHPDHEHAHELIKNALFYSGLIKRKSGGTAEPWRPVHVLEYMHDYPFEPDVVVDISEFWETKKAGILAYGTQFNTSDDSEPATYISDPSFFEYMEARARYFGHMIGVKYGEPFRYHGGPLPLSGLSGLMNFKRKR